MHSRLWLTHPCAGNITNAKHLEMNYANYDEKIVIPYRIKLVGHPFGVKNPSDITTINDLRTLRAVLKSGDCKWVRLTQVEVAAHTEDLEQRHTSGEAIGKARKKRSDAGVSRGSRKRTHNTEDNDENRDPSSSKKRKVTGGRKSAAVKSTVGKGKKKMSSREIIEDSDSDPKA